MTDFFRNIAPGVARLGTGYLSAQRATQEKVRQEEMQRDKDALGMYMDLVKSGQWEPVDPKKGAQEGGVLAVGGMFLQPRALSLVDQAKFEHEKSRWAKEREGWDRTTAEAQRAREHAEAQRIHEKEKWQHELEKLKLDKLKKDEEKGVVFTDKRDGMKTTRTPSEVNRIMKTDPRQLSTDDRKFQQGMITGDIVQGEPTAMTDRPRDPHIIGKETREEQRKLFIELGRAETDTEYRALVGQLNKTQSDEATEIFIVDEVRKFPYWSKTPEAMKVKLPIVPDREGRPRQMVVGDIRDVMDETGLSFEDAYRKLMEKISEYMKGLPGGAMPTAPPRPSVPIPAYPPPVMKPLGPPVS